MKSLPLQAGNKFGRLTVIRELERTVSGGKTLRQIEVQCDCGKITVSRPSGLATGRKQSCGCLQREKASDSGKLRRKSPGEHAINTVYNSYVQAARKRRLEFSLSREQVVRLIFDTCRYCGSEPKNIRSRKYGMFGSITYNGIDRVDNSTGYVSSNCVTACETCNIAKQKMGAQAFTAWITRVHNHLQEFPL